MGPEIALVIQLLALLEANAPWIIQAVRDGRASDIDWKALRPQTQQALEDAVDCPGNPYEPSV